MALFATQDGLNHLPKEVRCRLSTRKKPDQFLCRAVKEPTNIKLVSLESATVLAVSPVLRPAKRHRVLRIGYLIYLASWKRVCFHPFKQPGSTVVKMKIQLVLMIHERQAWLCRGDWNRRVDRDEFIAWSTYSGIELRPFEESESLHVVLSTNHQERLFDVMWVIPAE